MTGTLADPYGQLEIRPGDGRSSRSVGRAADPVAIARRGLGEADEGRLVTFTALVGQPSKATEWRHPPIRTRAGRRRVKVACGRARADRRGHGDVGTVPRSPGSSASARTRKGALDGYRVWLRDAARPRDPRAGLAASRRARPRRRAPAPRPRRPRSIAAALEVKDRDVGDRGRRDRRPSLLDATGRRIVVQDATGGDRSAAADGRGRARGRSAGPGRRPDGLGVRGPRLRADVVDVAGTGRVRRRSSCTGALRRHAWRLVLISGRIEDVHKLGDRWRAEARRVGARVVVVGQAGAGIPVTYARRGPAPRRVDRHRPPAVPERVRPAVRGAAALAGGPRRPVGRSGPSTGRGAAARPVEPARAPPTRPARPAPAPRRRTASGRRPRRPRRRSSAAGPCRRPRRRTWSPTGSSSTTAPRSGRIVLAGAAARVLGADRTRRRDQRDRPASSRDDAVRVVVDDDRTVARRSVVGPVAAAGDQRHADGRRPTAAGDHHRRVRGTAGWPGWPRPRARPVLGRGPRCWSDLGRIAWPSTVLRRRRPSGALRPGSPRRRPRSGARDGPVRRGRRGRAWPTERPCTLHSA